MMALSWLSVRHPKMTLYEIDTLITRESVNIIAAYGALPTITEKLMASIERRASLRKPLSEVWAC